MSEKKEVFRVKRTWVGGPELGAEVNGPIPAVLLPNVERVVVAKSKDDDGSTEKAAKILEQAKKDSDEIIAGANTLKDEAAKILEQAQADVEKILADAKAEAEKIISDASKPSGNRR